MPQTTAIAMAIQENRKMIDEIDYPGDEIDILSVLIERLEKLPNQRYSIAMKLYEEWGDIYKNKPLHTPNFYEWLEDMQETHTLYDMAVKRTFSETDTEEKANIDYIVSSIVYLSAFTKEQVYQIIHSTWKHSRN